MNHTETKKTVSTGKSFPEVTFKPLSRGRFKCNQTGEIVKAGQTKKYAKWRMSSTS